MSEERDLPDDAEPPGLAETVTALRKLEGDAVRAFVTDQGADRELQGQLGEVVIVEAGARKDTVSVQVGIATLEIKPSEFKYGDLRSGRVTFHLQGGRVTVERQR